MQAVMEQPSTTVQPVAEQDILADLSDLSSRLSRYSRALPARPVNDDPESNELLEIGLDLEGLRKFGTRGTLTARTPVTPEEITQAQKYLAKSVKDRQARMSRATALEAIEVLQKARSFIATGWAKYALSNDVQNDPNYWRATAWCVVGSMARATTVMEKPWNSTPWTLDHDVCNVTL